MAGLEPPTSCDLRDKALSPVDLKANRRRGAPSVRVHRRVIRRIEAVERRGRGEPAERRGVRVAAQATVRLRSGLEDPQPMGGSHDDARHCRAALVPLVR